ncbi:hypothetical protein [Pseudovibrio sp. Tun.PSC04-5.I4]|uniref:hypothetical protein n=1 Tax=Pseudovibrio sp. Tun.PSC04-5.I4 TaxID=1798213 RepID=UPI000B89D5AE|nr:hypothetical protein [Pseudovibrio sp. Tun.PSC04-5.I4]
MHGSDWLSKAQRAYQKLHFKRQTLFEQHHSLNPNDTVLIQEHWWDGDLRPAIGKSFWRGKETLERAIRHCYSSWSNRTGRCINRMGVCAENIGKSFPMNKSEVAFTHFEQAQHTSKVTIATP